MENNCLIQEVNRSYKMTTLSRLSGMGKSFFSNQNSIEIQGYFEICSHFEMFLNVSLFQITKYKRIKIFVNFKLK